MTPTLSKVKCEVKKLRHIAKRFQRLVLPHERVGQVAKWVRQAGWGKTRADKPSEQYEIDEPPGADSADDVEED